jgi:hypothetical protein
MSAILKFARMQECTLRLHPYCNGRPETVVACHLPQGRRGMGLKAPAWWTVHVCSDCHDIIDGRRRHDMARETIDKAMLRAHFETMDRYIKAGFITVKGGA